jgi:hypothetical protein
VGEGWGVGSYGSVFGFAIHRALVISGWMTSSTSSNEVYDYEHKQQVGDNRSNKRTENCRFNSPTDE